MPIFSCSEKTLRTICDEREGMSYASETFIPKHLFPQLTNGID
jgi:hypothetical protein